ncbi:hypothetical protein K2173_003427 [Erythroxylum novogranatense]|uniref:Plasma membrane-like protein n=1 Tax=Erythroxylum novogranatense TaxID=1862640 RepID=A0AAV8S8P4_9ROSI|nr:hypothetical protein K2173_003427 [Erythroxylum novogranatense]
MERKGKGVGREDKGKVEKQAGTLKGEVKLKRWMFFVGKRGGPSTPSPTWRLHFSSPIHNDSEKINNPFEEFLSNSNTVSARKLCANLWEFQPQLHFSQPKMSKNFGSKGGSRRHHKDKKAFEVRSRLADPPNTTPYDQPASSGNLRRHAATSSIDHHHPLDRNDCTLKPLSPSCGSSMEVAPYKPVVTASSSLDSKGRLEESKYGLKTSTELLKVLNRIWSLEEQQVSNLSLLKALKRELVHSQSQVKELRKEKLKNRQEMEELMRQVEDDEAFRKNKVKDHVKAAIQSMEAEVENERKLRKHWESLHRKLAQELSQLKSSFSSALKDLERERKARILLESLCDEFAKGVREYEQELRLLNYNHDKEPVGREKPDRLVLHISEAWLDERMQMKITGAQNDLSGKNTVVEKLSPDIKSFLQARHSAEVAKENSLSANEAIINCSRRESFPLNEARSAPQDAADEELSSDSGSRCFELNNGGGMKQNKSSSKRHGESHLEEIVNLNSRNVTTGSRVNGKFPDKTRPQMLGVNQVAGIRNAGTSDITEEALHDKKSKLVGTCRFHSNHVFDNLVRNHSVSSEGDKIHPEGALQEDVCVQPVFPGHASPVQQWMSKLDSPEFQTTESSVKLPRGFKENTLEAKLMEARLEGQKSRSRASKGPL